MAIPLKRHAKTIFTHFNISVDAQKNAYYDQSTGYLKHKNSYKSRIIIYNFSTYVSKVSIANIQSGTWYLAYRI